jgi:uncharacterized protein YutE (UPF0331/DUF86 family)
MDWKQFFASMVGSLAWPVVVVALLVLLRKHLASMAERLEELTLPGGAKAKFDRQLDAARTESEKIIVPEAAKTEKPSITLSDEAQLANKFPEAAVSEAFRHLEVLIQLIKLHMPMLPIRATSLSIVQTLLDLHKINENEYELYKSLREARNSAVHARTRLTPGEAFEYQQRADIMAKVLKRVAKDLQGMEIVTPADVGEEKPHV